MANLNGLISGINSAQNFLNNNNPITSTVQQGDGFTVPAGYSADGNGLPYTKIPSNRDAVPKRQIISIFIPEFGIVRLWCNPQSIAYNYKKVIISDRTKGGYSISYFGEEMPVLTISGNTGSAGVEGINALYEAYRGEQLAFDSVGLTLAANSASADISNNLTQAASGLVKGALGGGVFGAVAGGILGLDSPLNNLTPKNIPSLAQLALGVEIYYSGWVFRGYFTSMTVNEQANDFLLNYVINFTVTQRRGVRANRFVWEHSANSGPSQYNSPYSFSGKIIT